MREFVPLLLQFLKHPTENSELNQSVSKKIKWLFLILLIDIPVMFVLMKLQSIPVRLGFIDASQHRLVKYFEESNIFVLVLFVIILALLIEEAIIRLPLCIKDINFIPLIFFGLLLNGSSLAYKLGGGFSWLVLIPIIFTTIATLFVFNKSLFEKTSGFLHSQYIFYFYLMSALFALLHLFNFQFSGYVLLFAPLLVLPQFIGGLLMGFIRLNSGFIWGVFLHMLHNALFLLPFYFFINTNVHTFKKLEKDGFQFELIEGKSPETTKFGLSKVTPNEIIMHGTFEQVISRLQRKDVKEIEFKNSFLAKKKISLSFINDSAYVSDKTDSACQYALLCLLDNYELQLSTQKRWTSVWIFGITKPELFHSHLSNSEVKKSNKTVRSFYGKNDTITARHINSKYVSNLIEQNFKINVDNKIDKNTLFSIKIPNGSPAQLDKYFRENYGLELKQKRGKIEFLIVE